MTSSHPLTGSLAGQDQRDPDRAGTPGSDRPSWRSGTPWLIVRALRPRQWSKNVLVFMAPAAAGVLGHWPTTLRLLAAFFVFCAAASGHYMINDVLDAEQDRRHPRSSTDRWPAAPSRPRSPSG